MQVPLVELTGQYRAMRDAVDQALAAVLSRGDFILGADVPAFEEEFARYCEADHCVAVANGTEALHLALRALRVGPGDEVIVPANSFVATALAVSHVGAAPVFVDVSAADYCLDATWLERAISPRTKAVIPVHLYGQPVAMDPVMAAAHRHGLAVIEDACQAHGARYRGRRAGAIGDIGCFSFYPSKNLGAYGDGGAIVTSDARLAEHIRLLRNYAQVRKNEHAEIGFNSRLDSLQAAVLRVKLAHLDRWNDRRRRVAARYEHLLAGLDLRLPVERADARHVYHLYVVRHRRRDELAEFLKSRGIGTGVHYPLPLPRQAPYRDARTIPAGVPLATRLAGEILSLPMYPEMVEEQIAAVADALRAFSHVSDRHEAREGAGSLASG